MKKLVISLFFLSFSFFSFSADREGGGKGKEEKPAQGKPPLSVLIPEKIGARGVSSGGRHFPHFINENGIKQISGPISFRHLRYSGKDLFFFGDKHGSKEGNCQPCESSECYSITQLLDRYFRESQRNVDFSLEDMFRLKEIEPPRIPQIFEDYLQEIRDHFQSCLNYTGHKRVSDVILDPVYREKCQELYPKTFFHYSDIRVVLFDLWRVLLVSRSFGSGFPYLEKVSDFFCDSKKIKNDRDLKSFVNLFVYSEDFPRNYRAYKGVTDEELTPVEENYLRLYPGPHKIAKQINKLREKHKRKVLDYYESIWHKTSDYTEEERNFTSYFDLLKFWNENRYEDLARNFCSRSVKNPLSEDFLKFERYFLYLTSQLTNVYALSRALGSIENDRRSQEYFFYWGEVHIFEFYQFLKNQLGGFDLMSGQLQESERCVRVNQ